MRQRLFLVFAVVAVVASIAPYAGATPHDPMVFKVTQISCDGSPCHLGEVRSGEITGGVLKIEVSAAADLGLEFVRLEAFNPSYPSDPRYYCLELWQAGGARTFTATRTWYTTNWTDPRKVCEKNKCSSCIETSPHHHGAPTQDIEFDLRVVAREQGQEVSKGKDATSPVFRLRLQNAPAPPTWQRTSVSIGSDGRPSVGLVWAPNPEEVAPPPATGTPPGDIREYRFVRVDPSGKQTAYAVDARAPEHQGCQRISGYGYQCTDSAFPSGAGGAYRYAVAAVRSGYVGTPCKFSPGTCVLGPLSRFVTINVPSSSATSPSPGASGSSASAARPTATSTSGAPVSVAPSGFAPQPSPAGAKTAGGKAGVAIGGLVALAVALGGTVWRMRTRAARAES